MRFTFFLLVLSQIAIALPLHLTLESEVVLLSAGTKSPIHATAKLANGGRELTALKCRVTTRWFVAPKADRAAGAWHSEKTVTLKESFRLKHGEKKEIKLADLNLPEEIARLHKRNYFPFGAEVTVALYDPGVPALDIFRASRQIAVTP